MRKSLVVILAIVLAASAGAGTHVTLNPDGVLVIDGKKTFPFSFSLPPLPGAKAPDGRDAFVVLSEAGCNFARIRATTGPGDFSERGIRSIGKWLDIAAANGMHCWVTLGELPTIGKDEKQRQHNEKLLRLAIDLYKDHPGLAVWKGYDEPAWVKMPASKLIPIYQLFKQLDPNHPVIIIQAPMKKSLDFRSYFDAADIFGVDIYPIAYPPGNHSDLPNKQISLVADWTKIVHDTMAPKPVWMTLQVATMVVLNPGKTLRYPTFFQQRYMAYSAIVNGARGINFQGGERPLAMNERDAKLGWNWTFFDKVMRPLLVELGQNSPLQPALVAADSKLPIKMTGVDSKELEYVVREVDDEIYILAAKRENGTVKVKFRGLPATQSTGILMFEEPRQVQINNGEFEDWFGPNEVHVYRIKRS